MNTRLMGKFTRNYNIDILLGMFVEYRHPKGGKIIAHQFGVATTGDIINSGTQEINDMRIAFEMAVIDHETLKSGDELMEVEDVHHSAVDRLWTKQSTAVSGYYAVGADPQDTCDCYRNSSIDCDLNGCLAIPGDQDFVRRIKAGEFDEAAEAQREREEIDEALGLVGYDPRLAYTLTERLYDGE